MTFALMTAGLVTLAACTPQFVLDPEFAARDIPVGAASTDPLLQDDDFRDMMGDFPIMQRSMDMSVPIPGLYGAYGLKRSSGDAAYQLVLSKGFTPQGLALSDDQVFVSAYDHKHKLNSVVFVFDYSGAFVKTISLRNKAHVGGIGYDEEARVLWIGDARDGRAAISGILQDTIDTYDVHALTPIEYAVSFIVDSLEGVSTLDFHGDLLWASYFTNDPDDSQIQVFSLDYSEPDDEGFVELTDVGDTDRSYIDEDGEHHIFADLALTAPKEVQGLAFDDTHLYVAQSFGTKNSRLTRYDLAVDEDSAVFTNGVSIELPPYLEQIALSGEDGVSDIHPLFESAQPAYRKKVDVFVDRIVTITHDDFEAAATEDDRAPELVEIEVTAAD
ncbi:hypothetical protein [Microbacterium sp. ZW T5_56]|uniref:hypothetical protein n=1 Tax=Microbacterium sp. ZW T5_56 TaxID=3378081 RepID=UPI0038535D51